MATTAQSFDVLGSLDAPASPVVLSVPHAGRDYPLALRAALRVPLEALVALEDRHVDRLAHAARGSETILVQRPARAWIDLNRAESERDPRIDEGAARSAQPQPSAKLRSGLGLVPRRVGRAGDLWRRRLSDAEVTARIVADHRPYHAALGRVLASARQRFGVAILLDVHSMPSLGPGGAGIVFGDRFGRAAAARFVHRLEGEAEAAGIGHALNSPYSGGHILDRHADPRSGVHAVQIEWDRALYLDEALDSPGPGLPRVATLLRRMIAALADEATAGAMPLAAE
ncbi:N-formylglutamate amidohydrolase [Sphingomonas koreensis]|nr:N-formylglutamate amidohydrolase [Sphingomonas koreensis]